MYYFSPFQQKWHFALKFCIQVSRILFFSNLFEKNYLSDLRTRCGIVRNHRTTSPAMVASFFPSVHYANRLPLMSQLSQSDIAPSGLCLHPIFCASQQLTNCMQKECISAILWPNPIEHAPNIHPNAFKNFYRTVTHVHDFSRPQINPFCTRPISPTHQQLKHYKLQNEQN